MSDVKVQGETGQFTQNQIGTQYLRMSGTGAVRVSQTEPAGLELARAGVRFAMGHSAAITGIAPVQAVPTTAAQWVIWNPDLEKSLVFEKVGFYLTAGTAGIQSTLMGALITLPANTANKSGITIANMSGSSESSVALINSGVTVTSPAAPAWQMLCRDDSPCTVALNVMAFAELYGRLVVPPLRGLALAVIAPTGTNPLYAPVAEWAEIELDLE